MISSPAVSNPTLLQRLANWCTAVEPEAVPGDVRHAAGRSIVDTVGVALAAAPHPAMRRILDHARRAYGAQSAGVLGHADRLSPVGAALVNATAAHILDFDDTSYTGIMHGSAVVLPAALAATQYAGGSGRHLMHAFVVGSEVTYATALLCTTHHYHKGWWSTGTFGAIGAAAAAAKALGLDAAASTAALALAAVQACGLKTAFGTDAKPYLAGRAAAIGVESAMLAAIGFGAPPAALEGPNGFIQVLNDARSDLSTLDSLGRKWRLVEPGILFKQFPVCSGAHAAVELTQKLLREAGASGDRVRKVVCDVSPIVAISLVHHRPASVQQAQFSMQFAVGVVLARGRLDIDSLTEETLSDPGVRSAMQKVEMRRDDDLGEEGAPEGARVALLLDDGRELRGYLGQPTGMPENPMSDERLDRKFIRCAVAGGFDAAAAGALLAHLRNIDTAAVPLEPALASTTTTEE